MRVSAFGSKVGRRQRAVGDRQETGGAAQRREQRRLGAGDPGLAVEPGQHLEQRGAPCRIEMRRNLVEQQERRLAPYRALQSGLGQQDRDQQRLLLASPCPLSGNALLGMDHPQIRAVPARRRAPPYCVPPPAPPPPPPKPLP